MKRESPRAGCAQTATPQDAETATTDREASIGAGRCSGCGGEYRFDTSIPSVLWNKVIRAQGLPEYLCTACIVRAFVKAGVSFTAELYGDDFHGDHIEVTINGVSTQAVFLLNEENNALRTRIRDLGVGFPTTTR